MSHTPHIEPPFPPREKTPEEVRTQLYRAMDDVVRYWAQQPLTEDDFQRYPEGTDPAIVRGHAMLFTAFSTLDGSSVGLPRFIVAPNPHPEDKAYCEENGEDWFPENHLLEGYIKADLGGSLHEHWHSFIDTTFKEKRRD